jgi:hypothetical protein
MEGGLGPILTTRGQGHRGIVGLAHSINWGGHAREQSPGCAGVTALRGQCLSLLMLSGVWLYGQDGVGPLARGVVLRAYV